MSLSINEREGGPASAETRQALLEAAAEVFAERGFRSTTVREVCQRAGANIAAVNYHFGDKEALYLEVLKYTQRMTAEKYPTDLGISATAPVAARLRAFIRAYLLRIFDKGAIAWHGQLMAREMIEPTGALDLIVEERIRPQAEQLMKLVREYLGPKAADEEVRWGACSIVSQCLFYHHCRPVVRRLFPKQKFAPADIERLAAHITDFSLAGLRQRGGSRGRTRD